MDYRIILYIIFGILPSLTWLSYYLRKDLHPEPKRMIVKIFLWGAFITIPVFFVQIGLSYLLNKAGISPIITSLIYWFLIIAFSEEFFKYLVVKIKVLSSPNMDEPMDIVIYMVVAALGFAAVENILYLFAPANELSFNMLVNRTLIITFIRFIGATFLHTLASAVIGYALAISYYDEKNRLLKIIFGVTAAVLLHGLYNFSIMTLDGYLKLVIPAIIIISLAFIVFSGFTKLKKMKGICKINPAKI
ncbi:MAG: PrsW family glutamic-type intramembrane protease [bacterium]